MLGMGLGHRKGEQGVECRAGHVADDAAIGREAVLVGILLDGVPRQQGRADRTDAIAILLAVDTGEHRRCEQHFGDEIECGDWLDDLGEAFGDRPSIALSCPHLSDGGDSERIDEAVLG